MVTNYNIPICIEEFSEQRKINRIQEGSYHLLRATKSLGYATLLFLYDWVYNTIAYLKSRIIPVIITMVHRTIIKFINEVSIWLSFTNSRLMYLADFIFLVLPTYSYHYVRFLRRICKYCISLPSTTQFQLTCNYIEIWLLNYNTTNEKRGKLSTRHKNE